MAVLDGVLLGILVVSMLLGAWRGLVFELFSLVGWVVGFFVARLFAEDVAAWLPLDGFVLAFVLIVFAWGLLSALAKQLVEFVGLRPVDRTLGAVFGVLRAAVLILVLAVVVVSTPLREHDWWTQSQAAPWLTDAVASVLPALSVQWGRWLPST